jgi:hypothetical protein
MRPAGATSFSFDAKLTASPISVNSRSSGPLTSPATPSPVLMPTWMSSGVGSDAVWLYSRTRRRISIAAFTAACAAFSIATGAPKTAMMQSPRYLSTEPPCFDATSCRILRQPPTAR